jgi:inner membrane protein
VVDNGKYLLLPIIDWILSINTLKLSMDSITQIVLGAAVGEAVAGKKIGNKAAFWGAIAGTIPDLDVFVGQLYHPIDAALVHRGFSHSVLFAVLAGPMIAYLIHLLYKQKYPMQMWVSLFFWGIITHPMLDMFTNYGTQFLWPLDLRITFNTVFVIDPLYTIPFMICLIVALCLRKDSPTRRKWNGAGIVYSCIYLLWGVCIKLLILQQSPVFFRGYQANHSRTIVTPMPLTSFYWMILTEDQKNYYVGYKSLFGDFHPEQIDTVPKNKHLLKQLKWKDENYTNTLQHISDGHFSIHPDENGYIFCDMRFGVSTPMTNGKLKDPVMGFSLQVKRNKIVKAERQRPEKLMELVHFSAYLDRVFGK